MPGFGIRRRIHYPILKDELENDRLEVPVVPLGGAWSDFPGDYAQLSQDSYPPYDDDVIEFYRAIEATGGGFSARDYHTQRCLQNLGLESPMVGDCAWYDFGSFGKSMEEPNSIERLAVSDPHSPQFFPQMLELLEMLTDEFPDADRHLCFHSSPTEQHDSVISASERLGYDMKDLSHDTANLNFYETCDLHVGYRCHAHISFLRKRQPSVLAIEDGRGVGFTKSFGRGGIKAFRREVSPGASKPMVALRTFPHGLWNHFNSDETAPHAIAPRDPAMVGQIRDFIRQELASGWRRYRGIGDVIESTYEDAMVPFIRDQGLTKADTKIES
jgi:hypothetical protein